MSKPQLHPLYRYDDSLHLKVPPLLWLVMIFGLRHVAVHVFKAFQVVGGDWAEVAFDWRFLISDALVLPLLVCTGFRVPEANTLVRLLWHRGRAILLAAYALDVALLIGLYRDELFVSAYHMPTFVGILVIDALVIAYLAKSQLVRDVFADFPQRPQTETDRQTK